MASLSIVGFGFASIACTSRPSAANILGGNKYTCGNLDASPIQLYTGKNFLKHVKLRAEIYFSCQSTFFVL